MVFPTRSMALKLIPAQTELVTVQGEQFHRGRLQM